MIEDVSILSVLEDAYESATWSTDTILLQEESVSELPQQEFVSLVKAVGRRPEWFQRFRLIVPAQSPYDSTEQILHLQNGLSLDDEGIRELLSETDEELSAWTDGISEDLDREEYAEVVEQIYNALRISNIGDLGLSLTVKKGEIVTDLIDETEYAGINSSLYLWTSKNTLKSWIERNSTEEIIDDLFNSQNNPYFLFVRPEECKTSQILGFTTVEALLSEEAGMPSPCESQDLYETEHDEINDLFSGTKFREPTVSPQIFDTGTSREIFESVFLYAGFACLVKSFDLDGDKFEAEIKTQRHSIDDEENLKQLQLEAKQLTSIYELTDSVIHSEESSSISLWQQSVATHCESITEIHNEKKNIQYYQGFLREESAKEELEELQNTVEEAFELTRTIADSLSEASQSLTADLQKITITLLGAIVTNFVLILRYSDFYILFPFSTAAIAGILIFYFPMIQNNIDETQSMMRNRASDFDIYLSEIRSHVGSRVFDLDKIEEQRKKHIRSARGSLRTAKIVTSKVYYLMIVVWLFIVFYAHVLTSPAPEVVTTGLSDLGFQTSISQGKETIRVTRFSSVLPAIWLLIKLSCHHCSCSFVDNEETDIPPTQVDDKAADEAEAEDEEENLFEDLSPQHYFEYKPVVLTFILIAIIFFSLY